MSEPGMHGAFILLLGLRFWDTSGWLPNFLILAVGVAKFSKNTLLWLTLGVAITLALMVGVWSFWFCFWFPSGVLVGVCVGSAWLSTIIGLKAWVWVWLLTMTWVWFMWAGATGASLGVGGGCVLTSGSGLLGSPLSRDGRIPFVFRVHHEISMVLILVYPY